MTSVDSTTQPPPIQLRGPHRPRAVRFLEYHDVDGWRLKLYGISADAERPRDALVEAMRRVADGHLPRPAIADDRYGVGFAIAHDAADFGFLLVDWWAGENELHQRLFSAPLDRPGDVAPHPTPAVGCVWELSVVDFERRAWLRHVLSRPQGPDLDAYMAERFNEDV